MRALVLYYSLEGHTRFVAELIAQTVGAEIQPLEPLQAIKLDGFKFARGGRQVVFGKRPELHPLNIDPADYDLVFIGTPVWAFTYAPALRTFFHEHTLTAKLATFCTHEGGPGRTLERMRRALPEATVLGGIDVGQPVRSDENVAALTCWAQEMVKAAADS